jgi:hypothetical protein
MFSDKGIVKAELVGQDNRFTILPERLGPIPVRRMHRHSEISEPHKTLRSAIRAICCATFAPGTPHPKS